IVAEPYALLGQLALGGVTYPLYSFLLTGVAILAGLALWVVIDRTRFGKLITSVIHDREISAALGVNVPRICTVAFTGAAMLAALLALAILPRLLPDWLGFLLTVAFAKAMVVLGVAVLLRSNLVSFGHGLYFAAGAYTVGFAGKWLHLRDAVLLILGAVVVSG